jgi:hypothetical protein
MGISNYGAANVLEKQANLASLAIRQAYATSYTERQVVTT